MRDRATRQRFGFTELLVRGRILRLEAAWRAVLKRRAAADKLSSIDQQAKLSVQGEFRGLHHPLADSDTLFAKPIGPHGPAAAP